jgi:hypothetical protein
MLRRLYSDPAAASAFSCLHKLREAVKQITPKKKKEQRKTPREIKAWPEMQDSYTMHRPVRKCFQRNPYTVNNIDEVWELDILDLSSLKKI